MPTEKTFLELLHYAAAMHHEQTAKNLAALRDRLGRDGTSMDEWNALVVAISDQVQSCERRRREEIQWATPVRIYYVEWNAGIIDGRMKPSWDEAKTLVDHMIGRGASESSITPVDVTNLSAEAICLLLDPEADSDGMKWHHSEKQTFRP